MNTEKFAEFLNLLNAVYQLNTTELDEIKQAYQDIYQNFPKFKTFLATKMGKMLEEVAFLDRNEKSFSVFMLLSESFDCYFDDWAFYCEDLCAYITKYAKQEFFIDDEEVEGDIDIVINKLEKETDFSLLHLWSGGDDVHFWLINKTDKTRLIELANELGIELD